MAEYIEREDALAALCRDCDKMVPSDEREPCRYRFTGCMEYYNIFELAAADVRPVVLCKDCKHKGWIQEPEHGKSVDYCRLLDRCVDKQFFCAAGERNCGAMMDGEGND